MKLNRTIFTIAAVVIGVWLLGILLKVAAWLISGLLYVAAIVVIIGLVNVYLQSRSNNSKK